VTAGSTATSTAWAIDLLALAIERTRPELASTIPNKVRVRTLWAAVKAARDLGAHDAVADAFQELAVEVGLVRDLGWHGDEDIRHAISWGLRGMNPFEKGPLK
jgi:hypothetical protein